MPYIASIGTYLPCWGASQHRVAGDDEDAITLAVEAGRAALIASGAVERVVLVSRDMPLLESSNAAVLLAGLGLDPELEVDERLGRVPEPCTPKPPSICRCPGCARPYSLVIVELDGVGVRALVKVTGAEPGTVDIGDRGRLTLRRVAMRSGVPDYGYMFEPERVGA